MRRKGVILLFFSILYVFIYFCNVNIENNKNDIVEYSGVVKNIENKKYNKYYYIDDILIIDGRRNLEKKGNYKDIEIGDKVIVRGYIKDLENWFFDEFNYGQYLKSKGIKKCVILKSYKIIGEDIFYKYINNVRTYIINANRFLYKDNSKLLNSIIIGFKEDYSANDRYLYSDSGTSHIIAISGMHIGLICCLLILVIGKINSLRSLVIISILLFLYYKLVGEGISIFRAIFMFIVMKLTFFIDKRGDTVNLLCIIASYSLYQNPYIIYNLSFQLSFLSVASLVIYNKYMTKYLYSGILTSSVSVMVLISPILLYRFKELSLVSIAGNLVVLPVIALVVILDIISLSFYSFNLSTSIYLSKINMFIIDGINYILKYVCNFGANNIYIKEIGFIYIIIYYLTLILFTLIIHVYYIKNNRYQIQWHPYYKGKT